jgi:prepilin-type N-terminal cleavage/methylation domain-containing protein
MGDITLRISRAFTLVELLIVIIIVSILAGIAIPKFAKQSNLSKEAALRANLKIAREAVERFYNDTGHFPQRLSWLNDRDHEVTPTFPALTAEGVAVNLPARLYRGPYVNDDSGSANFTSQSNPLGGNFTHSALKIIFDPISGRPFNCSLRNRVFRVWSSASGSDSNGVAYSNY